MLFSPSFDDQDISWINSRSPRQNDISRILDPSYSPSSSPSHSQMAYQDTHGDLHDPDYRDFPTISNTKRASSYPSRTVATQPCHSLAAAAYHTTRPAWDLSDFAEDPLSDRDDACLDDDDDDDDDDWHSDSRSRSSPPSVLHTRHHLYHPREYHRHYSLPAYIHSPDASPPTPISSPLPDVSDHLYSDDREKLRKRPRSRTIRSITTTISSTSEKTPRSLLFDTDPLPEADETVVEDTNDQDDTNPQPEWTPTCTQVMRRQWQSFSLRLRFGIFRAKRRVRLRFTGG